MHFLHPALIAVVLSGFLVSCGQTKGLPASAGVAPQAGLPLVSQQLPTSIAESKSLAAGTSIPVEIGEVLDSGISFETRFLTASIMDDVNGADGRLALPANSMALLVLHEASKHGNVSRVVLGLNRVQVAGKYFRAPSLNKDMATLTIEEDAAQGESHRSVHLQQGSRLNFKLDSVAQLQ